MLFPVIDPYILVVQKREREGTMATLSYIIKDLFRCLM